jgi:uncharacterized protein YqhQ
MSERDLNRAIEEIGDAVVVPAVAADPPSDANAKTAVLDEASFYADRHNRDMADRDTARDQRKTYAKYVFILVCAWITAIYLLLLFQVFGAMMSPLYRPLSDRVLYVLISSTTLNLIGTLIIVLQYIFRIPSSQQGR